MALCDLWSQLVLTKAEALLPLNFATRSLITNLNAIISSLCLGIHNIRSCYDVILSSVRGPTDQKMDVIIFTMTKMIKIKSMETRHENLASDK